MDNSTNFFGEGLWGVIIFLIVAGVFNGNGFGFGGNRGVDQVTNEFLFNNLANQNRDIMAGINQNSRDTLESRYTTQLGFQTLGSELAQCCCDLKTAIHAEGEATRDLITQNTIQDLRDRLSLANNTLASQTLTNDIINQVRPFPQPAYITCSPYTSYGYCGYNGCNC